MDLYTLPRAAFTSYLGVLRWPIDTTLKVAGRAEGPAAVAVDRADASVRAFVGGITGDRRLREDGQQRLDAANERTKAMRLRAEAELRRERAEEELAEGRDRAEQQRRAAAERASETRDRAEQQKSARRRQAAESERQRKDANERAEAKVKESIEERAKRERLETLEQRAEALDKQDDALTARDEAERLAAAAGNAKAARKQD
jgi:dTMP kinase